MITPRPFTQSARDAIIAGMVDELAQSCADYSDKYERQLENVIALGRKPVDWQPRVIGGRTNELG